MALRKRGVGLGPEKKLNIAGNYQGQGRHFSHLTDLEYLCRESAGISVILRLGDGAPRLLGGRWKLLFSGSRQFLMDNYKGATVITLILAVELPTWWKMSFG